MEIIICDSYREMSRRGAEMAAEALRENPRALLSFPGGDTPLGMIRDFVAMVNGGEVDISQAGFVSLDEWVGLDGGQPGSCGHFLRANLLEPLERPFRQVFLLNGAAKDLEEECARHRDFIRDNGPIGLSVLGIGMNGHLGFNEEGVDVTLESHVIPLSPVTRRVMAKYFEGREMPLTHGITQGIGQIMAAKRVVVMANGAKKAPIVARAARGPVTNAVPASVIQNHPEGCFLLDREAAAGLEG